MYRFTFLRPPKDADDTRDLLLEHDVVSGSTGTRASACADNGSSERSHAIGRIVIGKMRQNYIVRNRYFCVTKSGTSKKRVIARSISSASKIASYHSWFPSTLAKQILGANLNFVFAIHLYSGIHSTQPTSASSSHPLYPLAIGHNSRDLPSFAFDHLSIAGHNAYPFLYI